MKRLKLLVYADVNLNIMDGSSVWLAEMLSLIAADPRVQVDFLSKAPDEGGPLNQQVGEQTRIRRIEVAPRILQLSDAVAAIRDLDKEHEYDRVFVRGNIALGKELIAFLQGRLVFYTLEPFQRMAELGRAEKREIGEILGQTAFIVVQSGRMREAYSREFGITAQGIYVLPPLIPPPLKEPSFRNRLNTLCYTGKFSTEWGTPELLDVFQLLKQKLPYAKLNVAGAKFHGDLAGRRDEIEAFFKTDASVNWAGIISRQESINLSRNSDIGFALRSPVIDNDDSQELSTKLFEYMSAGKPVILRPTKVHKELLGQNYPLFAESVEEAAGKCAEAMTDVGLYSCAAKMAYDAYKRFARDVNHQTFIDKLFEGKKTTILFAGHDLKFIAETIDAYREDDRYRVLVDNWKGHAGHDPAESEKMLREADIIFCEWGLGNIRWYSQRKQPGQRLIVRIHLQEIDCLEYLQEADRENIDRYIFIAPYRYEQFVAEHSLPRDKARLVFNTVNVDLFDRPKGPDASFSLGFVGIVPWRKRFDKALELFEALWQADNRYQLRVKGKLPSDYPWMSSSDKFRHELEQYDRLYRKIEAAPWSGNVHFDGHGNDMPEWYQKIGYLVSTSDFEGSHQAVAEAIASGTIPLMLPWAGADTIYPSRFIFDGIQEMADYVLSQPEESELQHYAQTHFETKHIIKQIRSVCEGLA